MTDLVVVGAGGHGRETLDVVEALIAEGAQWRVRGFLDDAPSRAAATIRDLPLLGGTDWLLAPEHADVWYVLGIGNAAAKARLDARLSAAGRRAATLVHPQASLTRRVQVGEGSVVAARAILTSDVVLGRHVCVNVGASVSHDCVVGDHCHLAPGSRLAGNVRVGAGCEIGIGAVVIQGIEIGPAAVVGAGAVVIRPVEGRTTVVGVPARPLAAATRDRSPTP